MNKPSSHKIGLYFGSFNPIHIGHMAIANYMLEFTDLDRIWFVISPHNPLKEKKSLLADYHRLEMVHLALDDEYSMRAIDIEFKMPQPSYTIDTLTYLKEKYPTNSFVVLMGGDSLESLHKWKNYKSLIEQFQIYVYARPNSDGQKNIHPNIEIFQAPQMEISASFIRKAIQSGKNLRYFLPAKVWDYVQKMHFYKG
ncbi:MAG: nicotinate-nucleotide adenylyltransferase [Bacteroidales bacterium]|nr:nicotinate-nucleotide adenylyltransferase [Bacteroidales bacterium]